MSAIAPFMMTNRRWRRPAPAPAPAPAPEAAPDSAPTPRMAWGPVTWRLLHTMAAKMREDLFLEAPGKRKEWLEVIYAICTNLPCPDCANHSKQHLNSIQFLRTDLSKSQLQKVLFDFHNKVNQRKGIRQLAREEADAMYADADAAALREALASFFFHFGNSRKNFLPKMMSDDLFRQGVIVSLKSWIAANLRFFDVIPN